MRVTLEKLKKYKTTYMIFMFVCAAQNIKSFLNMKFTGAPLVSGCV